MNKEYADKLVDAMESGKYRHGRTKLKKVVHGQVCHCVLGVLCDIIDPTAWSWLQDANSFFWNGHSGIFQPDEYPELEFKSFENVMSLSKINDRSDNYVPVIQYIKENWKTL